jgi:hypothetical protein
VNLHDLLYGNWIKLGGLPPDSLVDARIQSHWALQIVAAAGHSLVRAQKDDGHISTEWLDRAQSLVGEEIPGGLRVGLRLRDLQLRVMDKAGDEYATLSLAGRTLEAGMKWLTEALREITGRKAALARPDYDMPEHAVATGARFEPDSVALVELARWFADADRALQLFASSEPDATRVRCWPHHYDMATLLELGAGRSIGIGMSPGDGSYRQPYYYVSPYPAPKGPLPVLRGGTWHRRGWTGAVLTGSKLASQNSNERQIEALTEFLRGAIAACREVLDGSAE